MLNTVRRSGVERPRAVEPASDRDDHRPFNSGTEPRVTIGPPADRDGRRRPTVLPPARTVRVRDAAASSTPPAGTGRVPMVAGVPEGRRHGSEREVGVGPPAGEGRRKRVRDDAGESPEQECRRDARPVGATVEILRADAAGGRERQRASEIASGREQAHPGDRGLVRRVRNPRADGERGDGEARRGPSVRPRTASEQAREPTAR